MSRCQPSPSHSLPLHALCSPISIHMERTGQSNVPLQERGDEYEYTTCSLQFTFDSHKFTCNHVRSSPIPVPTL